MTKRTIKILNGMSEDQLKKQYSVTTDTEIKDYIQNRLDAPVVEDAIIVRSEVKVGEI